MTGFGFDVEHLPRWRALVSDPSRWTLLERAFNDDELAKIASNPRGTADAAAGLWVAKEAVVKVFGRNADVGIRDVAICWDENGRCQGTLRRPGTPTCLVSISYAGEYVFGAAWSTTGGSGRLDPEILDRTLTDHRLSEDQRAP